MANKMSIKKKASAVVAGVLAVALAVGGAYAWTDYSQSALNTFNGSADNEVRLHDDFDGENKDVYVENTGTGSVYVRVKFAEYLQIGNESILTAYGETDGATDPKKADPNDVTTWPVHQFTSAAKEDNICTTKSAHTYFDWNMSGAEKAYLAGVTEADGNGYGGLSEEAFNGFTLNPAGTADPQGPITIGNITTYKYQTLGEAAPITMAEWVDLKTKETDGSLTADEELRWTEIEENGRWILDTDGWAYWSKALAPYSATNLLLDQVSLKDTTPHDNWIYHIDVQLQAATPNDLNAWIRDNSSADVDKTVASPDNSIATATDNAFIFLSDRAGGTLTTADGYVLDADGNKYSGAGSNVYLLLDATTNEPVDETAYILAGQDGQPGTEDDNTLAGRSLDNNGGLPAGIGVTNIDPAAMTYEIAGGNSDKTANIIVTAGIDKKMGTYDDVLISKTADTAVLGTYEINGDSTEEELVGWNYLGGPIGNMLVTTEYVLDNLSFDSSTDSNVEVNNYRDSNLDQTIIQMGTDIGIANGYVNENVEVTMEKSVGNKIYVCLADHDHSEANLCANTNNFGYAAYYSDGSYTLDETSIYRTYFALSINEVLAAYGDSSTDSSVLTPRRAQGAPAQLNPTPNTSWSHNYLFNYQVYKDGNGDLISTTYYWLRSPGYTGTRASYVSRNGNVSATTTVTSGYLGARPACYLNLES